MTDQPATTTPPPPVVHSGPPEGDAAVSIRNLYKSFGQKVAVNGLTLSVPRGTFFGLVGPNGAGKSTTLKISTGLLRPDGGDVWVAGMDVWADPRAVKATIGVVPEDLRLFERLTGQELLEYVGLLRGFERDVCRHRANELLEVMDLEDAAGRLVLDYSTGMRKKIALGAAILHRPSVLFLDEPFESVDPLSVRALREILTQLVNNGATVVFSSHVMEVVERLCDHVAVVHAGSVVASGPTAQVCNGRRLEDVFADAVGHAHTARTLDWL